MNVCLLPSAEMSYESGSTIYAATLARMLGEQGHLVDVICSAPPAERSEQVTYHLVDVMEHPVIDDYHVSTRRIEGSIVTLINEICRIGTDRPIDVIHAHYATINSMAASVAGALLGVPYVVSCFGRDVFNGAENDSRYLGLIKNSLPAASKIICSNHAVQERVSSLLGAQGDVLVLQNPIDMSRFALTAPRAIDRDHVRFINVVSCFSQEKGIEISIRGFRRFLDMNPGCDATLTIIGQDEHPQQANKLRYESLASELGLLGESLFLRGSIPNREIPEQIAAADILIDSRLVGNFSSVIVEALSCGVFVIASDSPGNSEFIRPRQNGLLYASGNDVSLAECMTTACVDARLSQRIVSNARCWAKEHEPQYGFRSHVQRLLDVYSSAMEEDRYAV